MQKGPTIGNPEKGPTSTNKNDQLSGYHKMYTAKAHPTNKWIITKWIVSILGRLVDERLVNVWNHTTSGYRSFDESVQFFITTNGELQMPRRYALNLQIFACITGQLQYFSGQVFQYGSRVHSSCCTNSSMGHHP